MDYGFFMDFYGMDMDLGFCIEHGFWNGYGFGFIDPSGPTAPELMVNKL